VTDPTKQIYRLVPPDEYLPEHRYFLDDIKESICVISAQTNLILGAKDIYSRHIIATDVCAGMVRPGKGAKATGCRGSDSSWEGCTEFAAMGVQEEQSLLYQPDINKKISVLNIHEIGNGLNALVFEKQLLRHHPSKSILGTIYNAREIEMSNFFSFIPNYILEFGLNCSIENVDGASEICEIKLSEYEHEVCYLLTMNWSCKQIAEFLNKYRPKPLPRGVDTIYKCRNRICDKFGLSDYNTANLREHLVGAGMHRKMPRSFFRHISGSKSLSEK